MSTSAERVAADSTPVMDWHPSANLEALRARARLLAGIRQFFAERQVLEVETPLLCSAGVTDPALEPFVMSDGDCERFLQTSPEYAMKRLLAAGAGDIYQLGKAFRAGEVGRRHNPEYTLLEWYRLDWDHHQLMREVAELICALLGLREWQIWPWGRLFQQILDIDAHRASDIELRQLAQDRVGELPTSLDRDELLDLLMSHCIEPAIADWGMVFVTEYPQSQASLARLERRGEHWVGARFECYVQGIELANGFWECADAHEMRARFEQDNRVRQLRGQAAKPIDERFLAALEAGLPDCAGVALGVDRLLALQLGTTHIRETLAFDWAIS